MMGARRDGAIRSSASIGVTRMPEMPVSAARTRSVERVMRGVSLQRGQQAADLERAQHMRPHPGLGRIGVPGLQRGEDPGMFAERAGQLLRRGVQRADAAEMVVGPQGRERADQEDVLGRLVDQAVEAFVGLRDQLGLPRRRRVPHRLQLGFQRGQRRVVGPARRPAPRRRLRARRGCGPSRPAVPGRFGDHRAARGRVTTMPSCSSRRSASRTGWAEMPRAVARLRSEMRLPAARRPERWRRAAGGRRARPARAYPPRPAFRPDAARRHSWALQ